MTACPLVETACSGPCGYRNPLDRRRRVDLEKIEQAIAAHVSQPARVEHGEDTVLADGLMERNDQMLLRDGALGEELFH